MKTLGTLSLLLGIVLATVLIRGSIVSDYHYNKEYLSYWTLADKSSSIAAKSDYIDQFVTALQGSGLQGSHDALLYPTPDNSFDSNFQALQSLQSRLHEIKTMDPNSFQYQSAISQITDQEQGQADDMLLVFNDCWIKVHYYYLWNPLIVSFEIIGMFALLILGIVMLASE